MFNKKLLEQLLTIVKKQGEEIKILEETIKFLSSSVDSKIEEAAIKASIEQVSIRLKEIYFKIEELVDKSVERHSADFEKEAKRILSDVVAMQPVTVELKEQVYNYAKKIIDEKLGEIDDVTLQAINTIRNESKKNKEEILNFLEECMKILKNVTAETLAENPEFFEDIILQHSEKVIKTQLEQIVENAIANNPERFEKAILKSAEKILAKAAQEKVDKLLKDKEMVAIKTAVREVLGEQLKGYIETDSDESIDKITGKIIGKLADSIKDQVSQAVLTNGEEQEEGTRETNPEEEIESLRAELGHGKVITHKKYPQLIACVRAGTMPMLVGPAGTGKSTAVEQVARELHLKFYTSNRVQNAFELTGYKDASGTYQPTQFYQAYKNGGVFFLDEVDASSPDALVTINTAMAQGYMSFPNERVTMHPDFRLVAAGNTYGLGADLKYVGRNQLDAATLDRFTVIRWDYDRELEKKLIKDAELLKFGWALRKFIEKAGIHIIISTRGMIATQRLLGEMCISISENIEMNLLEGLSANTLNKILEGIRAELPQSNKYLKALEELIRNKNRNENEDDI